MQLVLDWGMSSMGMLRTLVWTHTSSFTAGGERILLNIVVVMLKKLT